MLSSCKEAMDPRLLRNERDSASMPSNKREEINRKRRESYQRKKEHSMNQIMVALRTFCPIHTYNVFLTIHLL